MHTTAGSYALRDSVLDEDSLLLKVKRGRCNYPRKN